MSRLSALAINALLASAPVAACGVAPSPPLPPTAPLVAAYDDVRAALADDDLARAQAAARRYAATLAAEAPSVPEQAAVTRLTAGLDALAAAADLDAARRAFGTTSEGFLQLVTARPSLKDGLYAFHCPMAPAYPRWVQREKAMKNPYMGRAMLECGAEVELAP